MNRESLMDHSVHRRRRWSPFRRLLVSPGVLVLTASLLVSFSRHATTSGLLVTSRGVRVQEQRLAWYRYPLSLLDAADQVKYGRESEVQVGSTATSTSSFAGGGRLDDDDDEHIIMRTQAKKGKEHNAKDLEWLAKETSSFLARTEDSPPLTRDQISKTRLLLRAWARRSAEDGSNAPIVVERILQKLVKEHDAGNHDIKIDTKVYNTLLDAWSLSNEEGSAMRAEEILIKMEKLYDQGKVELCPDLISYNACIKSFVVKRCSADAVTKTRETLDRMKSRALAGRGVMPNKRSYKFYLYALANSNVTNAAEEAESILEFMKQRYEEGDETLRPDVNTYKQVITCWARGKQSGFESRMQKLFEELLGLEEEKKLLPNTDVFNTVMGGWLKSDRPDSLKRVLQTLKAMERSYEAGNLSAKPDRVSVNTALKAYAKNASPAAKSQALNLLQRLQRTYGIKPDTMSNNILIDALCKSRIEDAPTLAFGLLTMMENEFKKGNLLLKPDACTYSSVIDCFVKAGVPKAPEKAEQVLDRMKEMHKLYGGDQPTTFVYNAVLNAWASSSSAKAKDRIEAMLNEMKDGHQTTMVPRPDKITYNTAIKAMSDGTRRGAERAEELLGALEKLASTDEAFRPDTCTYTAIISCYGRSDVENKPQRALELVTRMVQSYEGSKLPKDCISSFNAALNACAFAKGDERARSNAFHTLIFISKLLKVHTRPDHVTYGTILRGCSSLLPYGEQRYKVVEAIFRQACEDGMVGKFTLTQLWFAASPELYQLLTGVEKDERAKLRDMPHVWTRSVREKRDL